ncbi:MAG: undecaprenyldiphospho-muramoylpentapeptide beta-N-acetylglucosaminyltransferase [Thermodesulfobacteriota bacterium]
MRVLLTGGGTGGHLFCGIALAERLAQRQPAAEVLFLCTERPLDAEALARAGLPHQALACRPLKGMALRSLLAAVAGLPAAVLAAWRVMRAFGPEVAVGVGGYVTGPVLVAARLAGIPTAIHEQNAVPGLTNRWLGRLVDRIFVSLPGSERQFAAGRTLLTGNPVRPALIAAAGQPREKAPGATLLVLGGSQGATRVNELVVAALRLGRQELPPGFRLIHGTGQADLSRVRAAYADLGVSARVEAFFTDMAEVYRQADLLICRAGATTLAEITLFGLPALFIPYPYAADDHQTRNARLVAGAGGGLVLPQAELTPERLAEALLALLREPARLAAMGRATGSLARPEAADTILDACQELAAQRMTTRRASHHSRSSHHSPENHESYGNQGNHGIKPTAAERLGKDRNRAPRS